LHWQGLDWLPKYARRKRLAEAAHLDSEICFVDDLTWPDQFKQFLKPDNLACSLHKRMQKGERPATERDVVAIE
jgi:hypothetical protein